MNSSENCEISSSCSLDDAAVKRVLESLRNAAKMDHAKFAIRMIPYVFQKLLGRNPSFTDQYHRMSDLSLQFSNEHGLIAYNIARSIGAKRIVEFGTAFGFSTIYLAAAIKDNDGGVVIGSEFIQEKVELARKNIEAAGLSQYAEIRPGDARQSLCDPGGAVDMILLDGSKDLYIPILKMLTPYLRKGGVVLADNVCSPFIKKTLASYVAYVQNSKSGFRSVTLPLTDGFEFSIKVL